MRFNWTTTPVHNRPASKAVKAYRSAVAGALMTFQSSTTGPSTKAAEAWKALETQCREQSDLFYQNVFSGETLVEKRHSKAIFAARAALRAISDEQYISMAEARARYDATVAAARQLVA